MAYWVPQVESLVRAVAEGSWPLWNPHVGFGSPMLADASYQIFYPFTWLNLILSPATYYKALVVAHTALAGVGVFRLARYLGLADWPAFVAAALFSSCGPFVSTVPLYHHFVSAAWMPWVMLALEAALREPTARAAAWLGLAAAALLLGGSGDVALMSALLAALRAAVELLRTRPSAATTFAIIRCTGLALLLAAGVASAQWLSTLTQAAGSGRSQMPPEAMGYWSLAPITALDFVAPQLLAEAPLDPAVRARLYEGREPFLASLYLGAAAVPLVLLGALARGPGRGWLLLGALLFVALALGRWNPAYLPLASLPPFSLLRYPVKYLLPFALCACLLAGRGVHAWLDPDARRGPLLAGLATAAALAAGAASACLMLSSGSRFAAEAVASLAGAAPEARAELAARALRAFTSAFVLGSALAALALLRVLSSRSARWSGLLAGLLAVTDAARVSRGIHPAGPAELLAHVPPVVARLAETRQQQRVFSMPAERSWMIAQLARGPAGWDAESRWSLGLLELLVPPAGARWGIPGSYDGDFTGLAPASAGPLRASLMSPHATELGVRLLQLGNVGHVVTLGHFGFPQLEEAGPPLPSVFREPIRLLRVPRPSPRFYAVGGSVVAAEPQSYALLADAAFAPERQVVLAPPARATQADPGFAGTVKLLEHRSNRVSLDAELSSDGFVVLVEAWDAGWRAWIDGRPAPVLRANVLFRALAVPAGRHRIEWAYRPPSAAWGALIGGLSLAVAAFLATRPR